MTYSQSYTKTSTYTEARARYVMEKFFDDIIGLYCRDLITKERAIKWHQDITYVLSKEAANYFEIQFESSIIIECGIRYEVSDDGYIYEDSESGGINFYKLPDNTITKLFLSLREDSPNYSDVLIELDGRGWGTNGKALDNHLTRERSYSKNGYGIVRNKVGTW